MIKALSTVILFFILIPSGLSWPEESPGGIKIYSGYLHLQNTKNGSLWHSLFASKSSKKDQVDHDRQCSVEFISPIPFSHLSVGAVPDKLTYNIRFKNEHQLSQDNNDKGNEPSDKFVINIYTNDQEEYSISSDSGGEIFDSYIIYLVLGSDINHLEVVNSSGDLRYVLDKVVVRNVP